MNNFILLLGNKIDFASEKNDKQTLISLLDKCDLYIRSKSDKLKPIIYFYKANIYNALAHLKITNNECDWSWHQDEKVQEILYLRKAISDPMFSNLDIIIQCKIYTNLGNSLSQFGRPVEAINSWNLALELIPNFAMAIGNKGAGIISYAKYLYDDGHTNIMLSNGSDELKKVLFKDCLWDSGEDYRAKKYFSENYHFAKSYLNEINYPFDFDLNQWPIGDSRDEIKYYSWCLDNNLFLSPLNDILKLSVAAQDILHLPNHKYCLNEGVKFPNYFNIIKQEYITARFMLFESFNNHNHLSDKVSLLANGFDNAIFNYRVEQLKISFRLAYSIFDKISLFLNEYYDIRIKPDNVSFRKIWAQKKNNKIIINPRFEKSKNWPLRGLFYLSKDLFDKSFNDVALPEAKELASLRNRIEHRYLSVQKYECIVTNTDTHSYININELQLKTLKIISMAREAIIYLSLAMHQEEINNHDDNEKIYYHEPFIPINRPDT